MPVLLCFIDQRAAYSKAPTGRELQQLNRSSHAHTKFALNQAFNFKRHTVSLRAANELGIDLEDM